MIWLSCIMNLTCFKRENYAFDPAPSHIFSTPDSSHLLWVDLFDNRTRLQCVGRNSFGQGEEMELPFPPGVPALSPMGITSFSRSGVLYLIILDLVQQHYVLMVVSVSGTYKVPHDQVLGNARARRIRTKITNSLINCHADVWSRFPIDPSIAREPHRSAVRCERSILFVSKSPHLPFSEYFRSMVTRIQPATPKSGAILQTIRIETSKAFYLSKDCTGVSTSPLGYWLAGLLCLVPINIAVTASNQLLPLRDGLISMDLEEQLLGADILQTTRASVYSY